MKHKLGFKRLFSIIVMSTFIYSLFIFQVKVDSKNVDRIVTIEVKAGPRYTFEHQYGLTKLKIIPQMAIWLEDSQGNYVDTIFVTEKAGKSGWGKVRRPSALPIWSHQRGVKYADGLYMPDKKNPLPDAITGATAKTSFIKKWIVPGEIKDGAYILKVEVNSSFDYNNRFHNKLKENDKDYNDVSGQPSLLWEGRVTIGQPFEITLTKTGHGHPSGKNGHVYKDLTGLTSALEIVESITVRTQ